MAEDTYGPGRKYRIGSTKGYKVAYDKKKFGGDTDKVKAMQRLMYNNNQYIDDDRVDGKWGQRTQGIFDKQGLVMSEGDTVVRNTKTGDVYVYNPQLKKFELLDYGITAPGIQQVGVVNMKAPAPLHQKDMAIVSNQHPELTPKQTAERVNGAMINLGNPLTALWNGVSGYFAKRQARHDNYKKAEAANYGHWWKNGGKVPTRLVPRRTY